MLKKTLITVVVILTIVLAIPQFFTCNTTASLPQGMYIRTFSEIKQGQIVRFKLNQTYHYPWLNTRYLLKEVAAAAGDYVVVSAKGYYINGRCLGSVLHTDSRGNPLPACSFEGTIPAGYIFVTGHGNSFDSRYFGPVAAARVQVFKPLFTR